MHNCSVVDAIEHWKVNCSVYRMTLLHYGGVCVHGEIFEYYLVAVSVLPR